MIHATKTEGMQQSSQHFSILHPLSIEEVADFDDEGEEDSPSRILSARRTLWNFTLMSILFSANHGCVVACLALATARLGSTGAWQSGILYLTYTLSALLGATYVVKRIGSRNALVGGMSLYVAYVGCFVVALHVKQAKLAAYTGAAIGGTGAGVLWTAQGAYFGQAAEAYARSAKYPTVLLASSSTSFLAGIFAFWYLAAEVCLRLLSTVLLELKIASWEGIFGMYTLITILSAVAMLGVHEYPITTTTTEATYVDHKNHNHNHNKRLSSSTWYKVTAAAQLLMRDPKMKYMIGLNAVFGFSSAFLNTYVNGEVVPIALNDPDSKYIGVLSSWGSAVAAGMSLWFGRCQTKGLILMVGAACFMGVVLFFVILPDPHSYSWTLLLGVYSLQGIGRATFEGTLKAVFADYFCHEKEGAFANIVIQNGFSSAIGYILSFSVPCDTPSRYCVRYNDGSLQYILIFELVVIVSAIAAILGYWRASVLFQEERSAIQNESDDDDDDDDDARRWMEKSKD